MTDPFHVDPHAVRNLAGVQSDVAAALDDAMGVSISEIVGFEQRYGLIAAPAQDAVTSILAARVDVLTALSGISADLADRLAGAAQAYERADEAEAASLRTTGFDDAPTASGSSGTPMASAAPDSTTAASSAAVSDALTRAARPDGAAQDERGHTAPDTRAN